MSGRPFRRTTLTTIKALGGWSAILARIASGETMASIARDLGCSRQYLSQLLHENIEIADLFSQAQRDAAAALAEEAMQILDDVPAERDEIAKAKARAEHRKWLASVYDRKTFGEPDKQAHVNISIGQLHLDALRAQPMPLPAPPKQLTSGADSAPILDVVPSPTSEVITWP